MAENDIKIRFVLEGGEVKDIIRDTGEELTRVGSSAESASGGFSRFGAAVVTINQGLELAGRALRGFSETFQFLGDTLDRGNQVLDLQSAFETLGRTTGATQADLESFKDAMGGVITNAEALATANRSIQAGLDPKALDDVAKAARSYADSVGIDAKGALESFITSLTKGDDRALKSMGIIIDNKKAFEDYAKAQGVAADTLNELGKAEAIRIAATEALGQKVKTLGEVTNDSSDNFAAFKNALTDAFDQVAAGIAQNQQLGNALASLAAAVKAVDWTPLINGLSQFATFASGVVQSTIPSLLSGFNSLAIGMRSIQEAIQLGTTDLGTIAQGIQLEDAITKQDALNQSLQNLKTTYNEIANISLANINSETSQLTSVDVSGMIGKLEAAKKAVESLGGTVPKTVYIDELVEDLQRLQKTAAAAGPAIGKTKNEIVDQAAAAQKAATAMKANEQATLKKAQADAKAAAEAAKLRQEYLQQANEIVKLVTQSKQYAEIQEKLKKGQISQADAIKQTAAVYEKVQAATEEVTVAQERLNQALLDAEDGSLAASDAVAKYTLALEEAKSKQEQLTVAAKSGAQEAGSSWMDYASQLSGMFGGGSIGVDAKAGGGSYGYSYGDIGPAIGDLQQMYNTDYKAQYGAKGNEKKARDMAQRTGVAVSSIFTFGITAALYSALGKEKFSKLERMLDPIGQKILDKVFSGLFGQNEDTFARRQVRDFINKSVKGKGIAPIDLGSPDQFNQPGWADEFNKSPTAGTFTGVTDAMLKALGVTQDIGAQMAKVLHDNLGGSLNDLQLLIQATGLSAEQMSEAMINSFLNAEISATEAHTSLSAIQSLFESGIPGATGATAEAMNNLIESGLRGRQAVDALGDLGAEALEKNQTNLQQLQQDLLASGKYSAEDVQKLFTAISNAGIQSLEELKNVSNETAIGILAGLEGSGFAFDQVQQNLQKVKDMLDGVQDKEATVKINVQTNYDEGTQQVMNSNIQQVVYGQSAPGNA